MLIKVKAYPNAKKQEIIKKGDNSFEIKIKAKPENGKANQQIIRLLANYFNINSKKIIIIKGSKARNKIFSIPV